ncbi:MAG: hypothetical protein GX792_05480 [Bacteroidales bacterium]|nr:hypothetical protein [Bacteroidales bacterium]
MECFTDKLIDFKTEIVNKKLFYPCTQGYFFLPDVYGQFSLSGEFRPHTQFSSSENH